MPHQQPRHRNYRRHQCWHQKRAKKRSRSTTSWKTAETRRLESSATTSSTSKWLAVRQRLRIKLKLFRVKRLQLRQPKWLFQLLLLYQNRLVLRVSYRRKTLRLNQLQPLLHRLVTRLSEHRVDSIDSCIEVIRMSPKRTSSRISLSILINRLLSYIVISFFFLNNFSVLIYIFVFIIIIIII